VLRPKAFDKHDSHYIIRYTQQQAGAASQYWCWRVPQHLRGLHWRELLLQHSAEVQHEQLVLLGSSSQVLAVLGKLEEQRFIHCYDISTHSPSVDGSSATSSGGNSTATATAMLHSDSIGSSISTSSGGASACPGSSMSLHRAAAGDSSSGRQQAGSTAAPEMLFELPRYGLEFVLTGGYLVSCNYSGYRLRQRQLLVEDPAGVGSAASVRYTLAEFHQYLVLERLSGAEAQPDKSAVLVVVPAGQVQPSWGSSSGRVCVKVASSCDVELKVRSGHD
jgi:hypothetical protein